MLTTEFCKVNLKSAEIFIRGSFVIVAGAGIINKWIIEIWIKKHLLSILTDVEIKKHLLKWG